MNYLKPHKLKPLKHDILVISSYTLEYLKSKKDKKDKLEYLLAFLKEKLEIPEKKIIYGLNFLYRFKKINYCQQSDTVTML